MSWLDSNGTGAENASADSISELYPRSVVVAITVVYGVIFVTGVVGNVSTCIVIARNKSMHTATNYYLFSLAVSDMLLLISGLPPEMYRIWSPDTYVFGEAFCVLQGFAAETSANATVLTITAFTVERYVAICHPFLSHTMSKLSRAIRYIVAIWILALCLGAPQAIQFGVKYDMRGDVQRTHCTVVASDFFTHAFEISTFLFFVGPMTLITVLYVLIGVQLRKSRGIAVIPKRESLSGASGTEMRGRNAAAQNRVVNMLIAVVAAFFICWAPFHAQRLLAVYLNNASTEPQETTMMIYMILMHTSGILYFLSTTINPVLYHIMSNKFREAFKKTLTDSCRSKRKRQASRSYSILSRCPPSLRQFQRSISDGVENHINEELILKSTSSRAPVTPNNFLRPSSRHKSSNPMAAANNLQTTNLSTVAKTTHNGHGASGQPPEDEKYLRMIRSHMLRLFNKQRNHFNNDFSRRGSVESSHTISNSSLQDVDEMEYSSSDLVKYMEEINEDIA